MSQNRIRTLLLASLAGLTLMAAPSAWAQKPLELPQPALPLADPSEMIDNKNVERRLQREEKALRDLRQIVLQAKAQGNPVVVKDAGPDPEIVDLQSKVNDLVETLRRQVGQMETVQHDAAVAAKSAADANESVKALSARVDALEKQLAAGPAPTAGPGAPPPVGPGGVVSMGSGVLGTLRSDQAAGGGETAPPPGPGDEQGAYKAARQTLDSGDYVGGAAALQDFLQRYPNSAKAQEANYWLGRTLALRNMPGEAAAAYARALKGWPQTPWGGDAVVRLSSSLIDLKRSPDACRAMEEFATHYGAKATADVRTRAKEIRSQAACG